MANQSTKASHKLGFSSMRDANSQVHKIIKGFSVDTTVRQRHEKPRYPGSKKGY